MKLDLGSSALNNLNDSIIVTYEIIGASNKGVRKQMGEMSRLKFKPDDVTIMKQDILTAHCLDIAPNETIA